MNAPTESGLKSRYDAIDLITQEVLKRYESTPDPRLREIMLSLIRHIHSFAKEVKLTSGEWLYAMNLLVRGATSSSFFPTPWACRCSR
jgi:hypothetical protein